MGNPSNATWRDCCLKAVKTVIEFEGWKFLTASANGGARTLMNWHLVYRKNMESFPNKHAAKKNQERLR